MIITEKINVVGTLLTQGQEYEMLELQPSKIRNVSFTLQDDTFEFYVIVNEFAQYIIVSRGSFAIIPFLEPVEWQVKFIVEGEEEVQTEENSNSYFSFSPETKIYAVSDKLIKA